MSDSEQENSKPHRYQTRSQSKESKQNHNKIVVKRKIPVEKSIAKRQVSLPYQSKPDIQLEKKNDKYSRNNTSNYKVSEKQLDLGNVIGELFVTQLVEESNKLLKKKRKKDSIKNEDKDVDLDKAVNDISSEDESDVDSLDDIEGLPEEIEYTDEEHKYMLKLSTDERENIISKEKQLINIQKAVIPIRFKILALNNLNNTSKQGIIARLDHFYTLDSNDTEYSKLYMWVECLERMPFDNYYSLPVTINDNFDKINRFLSDTRNILDTAVFGHDEAKEKIIMTISKQISNPRGIGICMGIQGPMGNGKTTLVKEGICKALNRPFGFIALGGAQDSSYMLGHDYTYEGSKPGKIVEILTDSGCMNPVIYFDELDKISGCPKGDEIANFLCHLTDSSQNSEFQDKYLSRVKLDMSKAIFIFSYNDPNKVNPILLDRLYKIKTEGFDCTKKLNISKDYLIPKILNDFSLNTSEITFTDEVLKLIIEKYAEKEEGVRNLKRCIETIVSKVNVLRFLNNTYSTNVQSIEQVHTNENSEKVPVKNVVNETISEIISSIEDKILVETESESTNIFEADSKQESITENTKSDSIEIPVENDINNVVKEDNTDDNNSEGNSDPPKIIPIMSNDLMNKLSIKLNIEEKSDITIEDNDQTPIDPSKIIKLKIDKFKMPFEVNCENINKFLKCNEVNTSISHLYL